VFPYVITLVNCLLWTFYGLPIVGEGRILMRSPSTPWGPSSEVLCVLVFFVFSTPQRRVSPRRKDEQRDAEKGRGVEEGFGRRVSGQKRGK